MRLHTAGIESDLDLIDKYQDYIKNSPEMLSILHFENVVRKISALSYISYGLVKLEGPDLKESVNEKNNDIVGHDVYGFIRHLHRPEKPFKRYTPYSELARQRKNMQRKSV